jgi:hypothetical protein
LDPSENDLFSGTRLPELLVGASLLLLASFMFVRRLLRSEFELPLVSLAGVGGLWLAGAAFFWRFHDTDMYLTWRIIGDWPNEHAEKATAVAVVALNILAVALTWYFLERNSRALRFSVYGGVAGYFVAIVMHVLMFSNVILLLVLALPLLFVPLLAFFVGRRTSAA